MEKYGVLVVDDSAFMRKTICSIIDACPYLYVIGRARNGLDAIEKVERLKPAIVTLDIEMPELDGLETLKRLMNEMPIPVVMLSNGADSTIQAIELGAVDFVMKHDLVKENNTSQIEDFCNRLIAAVTANIHKLINSETGRKLADIRDIELQVKKDRNKELLIIGSSTGGPAALQKILTRFPITMDIPILVIQHMPPGFTKALAERFDSICSLRVKEVEHNETLKAGTIYIAPAGIQTTLNKSDEGTYIVRQKMTTFIETLYKPSIDVTLLSIATESKADLLTVILTGMGDDGLRGCTAVKQHGGTVLAESEETCVIYGMPKVVFDAGLVDKQLPLPHIFDEIITRL